MNGIKQIRQRHAIFFKFVLGSLCILSIPLIITISAYSIIYNAMCEDTFALNRTRLQQASNILGERFASLDSTVSYISTKAIVDGLIHLPVPSLSNDNESYRLEDMKSLLSSNRLYNDMIYSTYVFLNHGNFLITPFITATTPEDFYYKYLSFEGMDFSQWSQNILHKYNFRQCYFPKNSDGVFYYVQSIPVERGMPYGAIIVTIRTSEIDQILSEHLIFSPGCWAVVDDLKGNIITQVGDCGSFSPSELNDSTQLIYKDSKNGKMFINTVSIPQTGWRITFATPYETAMAKVEFVKHRMILLLLCAALIGIATSMYISYFNSRPLEILLDTLRSGIPRTPIKKERYPALTHSVHEVLSHNVQLREEIESQKPLVVTSFFHRLLRGEYSSAEEVCAILDSIGFSVCGKQLCIMIFKTSGYYENVTESIFEEVSVRTPLLKESIHHAFGKEAYVYSSDIDKIVVIAALTDTQAQALHNYVEQKYQAIHEDLANIDLGIDFYVYVGELCENVLEASRSYSHAKAVLSLKLVSNKKIFYYHGEENESAPFYYPADVETKLINTIRAGDEAGASKIMTQIYYQNVVIRHLSGRMAQCLFYDISSTMIKLCGQLLEKDDEILFFAQRLPSLFDVCATLEEALDYVLKLCTQVCERVNANRRSHVHTLITQVRTYLEEKFCDSNFSIGALADQFGMNSTYLSTLFREQMGTTLSDYVESLRIRKADELLMRSDLRIEEIAFRVGYNSAYAFRRAYKRVCGVSPKEKRNGDIIKK